MSRAADADVVEKLGTFLRRYYKDEVLALAENYPNEQRSLEVKWGDLLQFNREVAEGVLSDPEYVQDRLEEALELYDLPFDATLSDAHVRFTDLNEERVYDVGQYDQHHVTDLIGVSGQVTQLTDPKPKAQEMVFTCQRCFTENTVPQMGMKTQQPHECQGCERQGPFEPAFDKSKFVDFQMARVKLPPEKTKGDPHIDVHLYDDMVGELDGSERLELTGKLSLDADDLESTLFDYQLDTRCGSYEVTEGGYDDVDIDQHLDEIKEIAAKDDPVAYLADNLVELKADEKLQTVFEAAVLQLVGAGRKDPTGAATYRGDFHMLLLGDPGTGKSEVLDAVEDRAPRSKSASGKGLSKAGATAAAVRNDFGPQEWTLKAGLMVLANEGIACLDEIDKVDPEARSSMHSALERQRVDVVKAGIEASLPARTSLLAAGNPKHGRFDHRDAIGEQIDLPPSLMSRFDVMFMISDEPDEERDREIAEFLAESFDRSGRIEYGKTQSGDEDVEEIPNDLYQAYVAYARERIFPTFKDASVWNRLVEQYISIRSKGVDSENPVPITARKLEAFFRLAEASARARLSEDIEMKDAERAIRIIMTALNDVGIDPETGEFDADIVETGTPKSHRDRVKAVKAIIMDVEEEYEDGAPIDVVEERAVALDIDLDKLEHHIDKLKQQGEVYENKTDSLRIS